MPSDERRPVVGAVFSKREGILLALCRRDVMAGQGAGRPLQRRRLKLPADHQHRHTQSNDEPTRSDRQCHGLENIRTGRQRHVTGITDPLVRHLNVVEPDRSNDSSLQRASSRCLAPTRVRSQQHCVLFANRSARPFGLTSPVR